MPGHSIADLLHKLLFRDFRPLFPPGERPQAALTSACKSSLWATPGGKKGARNPPKKTDARRPAGRPGSRPRVCCAPSPSARAACRCRASAASSRTRWRARVRSWANQNSGGVIPGTHPNISESHSEISTRVPFCIVRTPRRETWAPEFGGRNGFPPPEKE